MPPAQGDKIEGRWTNVPIEPINGPALSITVPPMGQCYNLVDRIITKLANLSERTAAPPHLTLQAIFDQVSEEDVAQTVREVARRTEAFEAEVSGIGILPSPFKPDIKYIYMKVEPNEPLVRLYTDLKSNLQAIGAETYPFAPGEWIPHLTVASGKWTMAKAKQIARFRIGHELGNDQCRCSFLVRSLQLHRAEPSGEWIIIDKFSLQPPMGCARKRVS